MKNLLFALALLGSLSASASNVHFADHPPGICHTWVTLDAGTLVMLENTEQFNSDEVTVGKVLKFRVTANVVVNGKTAITTGAIAVGRVKAIEENTYNYPERITITLMSAQAVDGQQVPLNGMEQTFSGRFPGEGVTVETGQSILAMVMNNMEIRV